MGKTFFINYSEFTKFLVMENLKNVHGISWKSHGIRSGWQSGNPVVSRGCVPFYIPVMYRFGLKNNNFIFRIFGCKLYVPSAFNAYQ